jgi:hypothetical protein
MKTQNAPYKAAARPLVIYESVDPKWHRWSLSVPGIPNTQWFKSPDEAKRFASECGFVAVERHELPETVRITKSEHAALVAVADAAERHQDSPLGEELKNWKTLQEALQRLAAVRAGKAVAL